MKSITLTAPAKVNIFLKVLNKRPDGYHNISTLFERISLADKITITKIPRGIELTSDKFITRDPKENLVYKAAELILEYKRVNKGSIRVEKGAERVEKGSKRAERGSRRVEKGVRIRVTKRIPIAAGLGGGSSDAASTLVGIDKLFDLRLKQSELVVLGRKLGADVPFFLLDTPFALGVERGDKLKNVNCKTKLWHLVIYPGFKMATKDIYEAFRPLSRHLTINIGDVKIPRSLTGSVDFKSLDQMLYNDLEYIAIAKKRVLGSIIERLAYHLGRKAIVSGSGPSVFCLCRTGKEAIAARERLFRTTPARERKGWQIFIARTET